MQADLLAKFQKLEESLRSLQLAGSYLRNGQVIFCHRQVLQIQPLLASVGWPDPDRLSSLLVRLRRLLRDGRQIEAEDALKSVIDQVQKEKQQLLRTLQDGETKP
jgi:flagellar biosynthesis/type III secretory pathway chaperone